MEQGTQSTHAQSRLAPSIAVAAIVIGVGLRALESLRDRPLWLDEAMLALNIGARSFADLARPLDYDQTAPLLYLWIERAFVSLGGVSERTLRLLPFIAGVALVPGIWLVGRRLAGATAAAIATMVVAVSVTLVSFSAEAKQYGVDPLATLGAVWLGVRVASAPQQGREWRHMLVGGIVALLLSQPAVFTLGGIVLALAVHPVARSAPVGRRWLAFSGIVWIATFALLYVTVYRATADSEYMQRFWGGTFLRPGAPDFGLRLRMFAHAAFGALMPDGSAFGPPALLAAAWLVGAWFLWRRNRVSAVLVAAPLALATCASALGLYPVMDRLYLFAAPLTLLGIVVPVAWIAEHAVPERRRPVALAAAAAGIAIASAPTHVERITKPVFFGVGKQVVADVDSMSRGDAVYVAGRSFPLWLFYTTDWERPDVARLAWAASVAGAGKPAHNNAPPRGHNVLRTEAAHLARPHHGRLEIVGLPTGRQYLTSSRTHDSALSPSEYALPLDPDAGWAQVEVDRMEEVARPRLWVFGSHMFALDGAEPSLVAELQRRGVRLLMERRQGGTVAYHVEFPGRP